MCELFGLSARHATNVRFSFEEFMRHGGLTGSHSDGWGVAYYRGRDVQLIREASPASTSAFAAFIRDADLQTELLLSHVRKATYGGTGFENTHPFARELGGRMHVFAHNGHLQIAAVQHPRFRPIGTTDSERAFCALLAELAPLWSDGSPTIAERHAVLKRFAEGLRGSGIANFLYSDGELLIAHAHRKPRDTDDDPIEPGLHVLQRNCDLAMQSSSGVSLQASGSIAQQVVLVATVPLTQENWTPLAAGQLIIARAGELLDSPS